METTLFTYKHTDQLIICFHLSHNKQILMTNHENMKENNLQLEKLSQTYNVTITAYTLNPYIHQLCGYLVGYATRKTILDL